MAPAKGFVLALPGEWGSGKSSILNMIERRIKHIEVAALTVEQPYKADGAISALDRRRHSKTHGRFAISTMAGIG
jgi:ABC-type lipoprotein export system ATPase subunit